MTGCCSPSREGADDRSQATPSVGTNALAIEMATIPAGTFWMGTSDDSGYPSDGEAPSHPVALNAFSIGVTTVTNAQFAAFCSATGFRTLSETDGWSFVFGGLLPDDFAPTRAVVGAEWWRQVEGADWQHPEGPHSSLEGRVDHPVVHVTWDDAIAFCSWSGTRLPTEAEWERAARGGHERRRFPWGDELEPDGEHVMNVFQGTFPDRNSGADGFLGTAPVRTYPPNDYGLHETTGNVWEWCSDWFDQNTYTEHLRANPTGPAHGGRRVMRGGSYLCHHSYCTRYRVAARSSNTPDSSAGNIGFRVVR